MIEWLKILLEHEGYEVRTAMIGTRGEEIFKTWRPDVVVTDMMLPDVDGLELLRKFKQTHADTEVIVITGHGSVPKAVEAMKAGAHSFVEKPIEPDTLLAMLERAIERRDLRRREPAAQAEARGAVPLRQHHRQEQEDARGARAGGERRRQRRQHPDPGRERHRQGADRQRDPLQQQAREGAVHQDQLRGDSEGPDRVGAVRLQEGRVHRRADRQGRPVRDGRGRLAAARRDRRDAALPADQAAARAAGARVPPDRQRPHRPRRLPADLRDQHRSRRGAARRQAARGPLLPHQHHHAARAAAARADRRHPAAVRALPREVPPAAPAQRQVDRAGGVSRADPAPLAGQRPRAGERHRARRAGRQGQRDHRQRSARVAPHRDGDDARSS